MYWKLGLAVVLVGLGLSLQGCGHVIEPGTPGAISCKDQPVATYGVVTGKISEMLGADCFGGANFGYCSAHIECDTGLSYHGPALECAPINKACDFDDCITTAGFIKTNSSADDREGGEQFNVTAGGDIKAQSQLLYDKNVQLLADDELVVCTPYPPASFLAWDDLTDIQRQKGSCLGYTKEKWDGNEDTDISKKDWVDLTEAQQACATALGWKQATWDWMPEPASTPPPAKDNDDKSTTTTAAATVVLFSNYPINLSIFSPMGVSVVLFGLLVTAVSIRFVASRGRQQQRMAPTSGRDEELLEEANEPAE